jgi:hypothetical protein
MVFQRRRNATIPRSHAMRAPQDRQKCDWPRFGKKSGATRRPINVRASRRDYIFL